MNNLLRTLTESQVKPASDLRLLLTTVKEGRRQSYDAKLSDPFYDSLEGLLVDLKSITIDNRDAEAFLKPVSKAEVPDYYDVIANPMDFQTMLKKVKQKQYKSKREFKDDLELIWSNCYTYNATENHPLRQCVTRLKAKADKLLKYITDRKERTDPPIPSDLPSPIASGIARPKYNDSNGFINGHHRSPSFPSTSKSTTPTSFTMKSSIYSTSKRMRTHDIPFPDTPAIVRTQQGMTLFKELDRQVAEAKDPTKDLVERLRDLTPFLDVESETEADSTLTPEDMSMMVDGVVGDKRKLNGVVDHRPQKRARFTTQHSVSLLPDNDDPAALWWGAVQSDVLLGNGLPGMLYSSSSPSKTFRPHKPKRRKSMATQSIPEPQPKSMLTMMNTNIKTMKRMRHTHAKFAALNASNTTAEDGEGVEGTGFAQGSGAGGLPSQIGPTYATALGDIDEVDDKIDERPWSLYRGKGKGRTKINGAEIGEKNATECLTWMNSKILEHAGFQGTSKVALDVLVGVTSEYLFNVGRTIRFLSDKYSKTMSPEEIILHTLFESGTSKVQDLYRYIHDDVERYGSRLGELEKKLVSAYRESTAGEILEDEGLFDEEGEEETGALAMGDFADLLGEDYLGLRELGIAAEFGMSSLSIPKRLLKGKKGQNKPAVAKPTEPPPPYPPPPPFIPLVFSKVEDQIGLLQPYYQSRFTTLAVSIAPPPHATVPPIPGPAIGINPVPNTLYGGPYHPNALPNTGKPVEEVKPTVPLPTMVLPDDPPDPTHSKMGPLGQIVKGSSSAAAKKKANKSGPEGTLPGVPFVPVDSSLAPDNTSSTKKKKGTSGVGSGNGRKKRLAEMQAAVPGSGQGGGPAYIQNAGLQSNGHGQSHGSPPLPPVVVASA